ncbi:MAG: hypothetical protein RLZ98_3252 [Pseudomonadota bacterium]|jgi:L-fuculose-phosphate aldolase
MTRDEAKQLLIDGCRILEKEGHADMTRGHLTIRLPDDQGLFYMKPHSYGFDEVTTENIVTCDLEGRKVDGTAPRHSEVYIHSEIFKVRPDVQAVLHTHPDYSVAVSATGRLVKGWSQPGCLFVDNLGVYTDTPDLIRSHEMGAGVAKALGKNRACFMKNHGVAVVGTSVADCVVGAIMLENACRVQILAESTGSVADEFPHEMIMTLQKKLAGAEQMAINFDYLRRKHCGRR